MKTIRCFLGVKLDYDTAKSLSRVQLELKKRFDDTDAKVNWVPPPNMHITIQFLGQVTEPLAYTLKGMLKPAVSQTRSFDMEAAGLGVFPDMDKPKVLWAGLKTGQDELGALYNKVSERLVEAGFHFEEKAFSAHITIGRIKEGNADPLKTFLEEHPDPTFGNTLIRNLYCYRSDLNTRGSEYHTMWRLPMINPSYSDSHRNQRQYSDREPNQRPKGDSPHDDETK